jgi:hypothetical protein
LIAFAAAADAATTTACSCITSILPVLSLLFAAGFGGARPFNYFVFGTAVSEVELDNYRGAGSCCCCCCCRHRHSIIIFCYLTWFTLLLSALLLRAGFGGVRSFNCFVFGTAVSEMELDTLTGDWQLLLLLLAAIDIELLSVISLITH